MATTARFWSKLSVEQARKTAPRVVSSGQGAKLQIDGKQYLNFCSSHYLGFAEEPRLKKAAQEAIERYGLGTGYRTLSGTHALHVQLEKAIAEFKGTEAAVCFSSAYAANASAVQTILGKDDIVVSDQLNHASIIDAVRVAGVRNKLAYAHSDMADLERKLIAASELQKTPKPNGEHPLILIITDGVFSMDGDLAPLPKIVELAKKYDALTMVDDAHGEGVLGKGGRGLVNHFGLEGEVDIEIGSLSKAFSVMGGFIAAKQPLVDCYLMGARQRSIAYDPYLCTPARLWLVQTDAGRWEHGSASSHAQLTRSPSTAHSQPPFTTLRQRPFTAQSRPIRHSQLNPQLNPHLIHTLRQLIHTLRQPIHTLRQPIHTLRQPIHTLRQRLFSIALTIPDTAALLEAVTMLGESEHLVERLWSNVDYLRKGLTELNFDIGHSETPIIPVMLGDEDLARTFSARLFEEGVFASPICFPMVPRGTARVRVIVSASFSREDCDAGLAAFQKVAAELQG